MCRYRRSTARRRTKSGEIGDVKASTAVDSTYLFSMRFELPDSNTFRLWTAMRNDSVYVELVRSNRHFQLAERQFHWLSEYNR